MVDFYGRRNILKDLTQINEDNQLAHALFLGACYLADLHANKSLFHGDIKHKNLLVKTEDHFCSSDSGSLVPLTGSGKYIAKVYTVGFASTTHIKRVVTNQGATLNELIQEDFHQFKVSVKYLMKCRENELLNQFRAQIEISSSLIELKAALVKSSFPYLLI